MDRLLTALFALGLAMLLAALASVRREHIRVEYAVAWLLAAVLLLALSLAKATLQRVGLWLGVGGADALLMIAGAIFVVVLYRLSLRISGLKDANIALAQRVAILEYRLESLNEQIKAPAGR